MGRVLHPAVCLLGHQHRHRLRLLRQPMGRVLHPEVCLWGRLLRHHLRRPRLHQSCPAHRPMVPTQRPAACQPKPAKLDQARRPEAYLLFHLHQYRRRLFRRRLFRRRLFRHRQCHHRWCHRRFRPLIRRRQHWLGQNPRHHHLKPTNPNPLRLLPLRRWCHPWNHQPTNRHRQIGQTCRLAHQPALLLAVQPNQQNLDPDWIRLHRHWKVTRKQKLSAHS